MSNPVIAEVIRGKTVESRHRGSYFVSDARGSCIARSGDFTSAVFPRSAIKAFQCLPVIESGAVDHFQLSDEEIALGCSSHNGEPDHVRVARSILAKAGVTEADLECGAHLPMGRAATAQLLRSGQDAESVHNNCSGKHSCMLALARHMGIPPTGYTAPTHTVQREIATTIAGICDVDIASAPMGIDGCSVPNWAMPLKNLALGFARLASPENPAGTRIIRAVRAHPFMVAGTKRFDTEIMQKVPRLFVKVGAEGVYCGCIAHAGLGFALKCDDGATRAAEVAVAAMLANLGCWTDEERMNLKSMSVAEEKNWRKIVVGEIRAIV
jgi:L-asparaginase II